MKILKRLLDWFKTDSYKVPQKTIKDLEVFDTVWIKDKSGVIVKGWVYDINAKHIIVTVYLDDDTFLDYRFNIKKPLNQTQLIQGDVTLLLN